MVKTPPANAGDPGDASSTPGSGRSPGGGHGNPLQYSGLENLMDRGAGGLRSVGSHRVDMTEVTQHSHMNCKLDA